MNSTNIQCLPPEILKHIFSFLFVNDRVNIALVCKEWLGILNCSPLLNDIYVHFSDHGFQDICDTVFTRKFINFTFKDVLISTELLHFLRENGDHIKYLEFSSCSINQELENTAEKIYYKKLRILKWKFCYLNIFSSLQELKELHIVSNNVYIISDKIIAELDNTMPCLEKLVLNHPIVTTKIVIQRFYPKHVDQPSDMILSFPTIVRFIINRSKTLNSFTIFFNVYEHISDFFLKLFENENLRLKYLELANCKVSNIVIRDTCLKLSCITHLGLSQTELANDSVKIICNTLPHLRNLKLIHIIPLNSSVIDIFQLKYLQGLNLSNCINIEVENFHKATSVFQMKNLTCLNLSYTQISDKDVQSILPLISELKYLSLNGLALSDETVNIISKNNALLRSLSLDDSKYFTNAALCNSMEKEKCLSNIKGLRELHLSNCPLLTVNGILKTIKFLELQSLYLVNLHIDGFERVILFDQIKSQNPSLKKLEF